MEKQRTKTFCLDGDAIEIVFRYDETSARYLGDYPDFAEVTRFTPNGRPWVNATAEGCPYSEDDYNDCGSCRFFKKVDSRDVIGICMNDDLRR